jgi:Flp pilus assembly protein CpaB
VEVARVMVLARRLARRSLLWWTAALVVGALFAVRALGDLDRLHARARAGGRPVEVVVAARDLGLGATVAPADLATRTVPEDLAGPGTIRDAGHAVGRVVAVPVLAGAVLSERHLAPAGRTGLAGVLPSDRRLVRVVAGTSARVRAGDVVDVIGVSDTAPAAYVVEGVVVAAVDDDDVSGEPAVTLSVSPEDALHVADAAAHGTVTIVLAPPEAVASAGQ